MRKIVDLWITSGIRTIKMKGPIEKEFSSKRIKEALRRNKVIQPDRMEQLSDEDAERILKEIRKNKAKLEFKVVQEEHLGDNIFRQLKTKRFNAYIFEIKDPSRVRVIAGDNTLDNLCMGQRGLVAINAGGFSIKEGKKCPSGILIKNKKIIFKEDGDKTKYNIIGLNTYNELVLEQMNIEEIKERNIRDAVSFHPYLIVNKINSWIIGDGGWGLAPRTGIGQKEDGTIIFLVIEGRKITSIGGTMRDMQDIFIEYGAINAANLDGGASSAMYIYGEILGHENGGIKRKILSAFSYDVF